MLPKHKEVDSRVHGNSEGNALLPMRVSTEGKHFTSSENQGGLHNKLADLILSEKKVLGSLYSLVVSSYPDAVP